MSNKKVVNSTEETVRGRFDPIRIVADNQDLVSELEESIKSDSPLTLSFQNLWKLLELVVNVHGQKASSDPFSRFVIQKLEKALKAEQQKNNSNPLQLIKVRLNDFSDIVAAKKQEEKIDLILQTIGSVYQNLKWKKSSEIFIQIDEKDYWSVLQKAIEKRMNTTSLSEGHIDPISILLYCEAIPQNDKDLTDYVSHGFVLR